MCQSVSMTHQYNLQDETFRIMMGREFQLWGPAIENARSPAFMKVRGTTRLGCERRPSRLGLLKSSMSEMYGGKKNELEY